MIVLLVNYFQLVGQEEKELKNTFNKEHISVLSTIPESLSSPWKLGINKSVYPEGLNLPMIDVWLFNDKDEESLSLWGVSVYLFEKDYVNKVKNYFNDLNINNTYTILKTKNYIVVISHGFSVPYDEFVKKNTIFLQKYNKLLPELEEFFEEKKRKL